MKVFVDTNVLIDYICKREQFFVAAKAVFALCFLRKIDIIISSISVVNAVYIGRKHDSIKLKSWLLEGKGEVADGELKKYYQVHEC